MSHVTFVRGKRKTMLGNERPRFKRCNTQPASRVAIRRCSLNYRHVSGRTDPVSHARSDTRAYVHVQLRAPTRAYAAQNVRANERETIAAAAAAAVLSLPRLAKSMSSPFEALRHLGKNTAAAISCELTWTTLALPLSSDKRGSSARAIRDDFPRR